MLKFLSAAGIGLLIAVSGCGDSESNDTDEKKTGPRVKVNQEVKVFGVETFPTVRMDYETDSIYFPLEDQAALADLLPGDIIAVTQEPGYIGMVTNYETVGNEIRVDTIDVPLTLVFDELEFDFQTEPGATMTFLPDQSLESATRTIGSAGKYPVIYLGGGVTMLNSELDVSIDSIEAGLKISLPDQVCTGSPFPKCGRPRCHGVPWKPWTWHCHIDCDPPTLSCHLPAPYLESFKFITYSQLTFDFEVDANLQATGSWTLEKNLVPSSNAYPIGVVMGMRVDAVPQLMVGCKVFGQAGHTGVRQIW